MEWREKHRENLALGIRTFSRDLLREATSKVPAYSTSSSAYPAAWSVRSRHPLLETSHDPTAALVSGGCGPGLYGAVRRDGLRGASVPGSLQSAPELPFPAVFLADCSCRCRYRPGQLWPDRGWEAMHGSSTARRGRLYSETLPISGVAVKYMRKPYPAYRIAPLAWANAHGSVNPCLRGGRTWRNPN